MIKENIGARGAIREGTEEMSDGEKRNKSIRKIKEEKVKLNEYK